MNILPATFCGDFLTERIVLLASIPVEAESGFLVRAVHVLAGETILPDTHNQWVVDLGTLTGGVFTTLRSLTFPGGFAAGEARRIDLSPSLPLERGALVAAKVYPTGGSTVLTGLCLALEVGLSGARR